MNKGLSERMDTLRESATLALNARAKQMSIEGKTIYNLTAGELASDTPEYIQNAVSKTLYQNKYTAVAGTPKLRSAIAKGARDLYGLDWINDSNVVVTAGAKPALYASFLALLNQGDEVIIPTPSWTSHNHLVELAGGKVVQTPLTENFDLNVKDIQDKITARTKAILINSPHNPTGAVFSKASLEQLSQLLSDTDIYLVSDDLYVKLVYDENFTLVPTCNFNNLIIINGFSKSQALTGWRIGYVIAEVAVANAITNLLSHITGNASVPSQEAALAAMDHNDTPPVQTIEQLKNQRKLVDSVLSKIPKLKYMLPGGAFYFFLDLRAITDNSAKWCEELLISKGVALVPGEAFNAPGFARLTFVTDQATLKSALTCIKDFITESEKK